VPEVDVARASEVEDHDAGAVIGIVAHDAFVLRAQILRKRQADGGERPDRQELAPRTAGSAEMGTIAWCLGEEVEHAPIVPKAGRANKSRGARGTRRDAERVVLPTRIEYPRPSNELEPLGRGGGA